MAKCIIILEDKPDNHVEIVWDEVDGNDGRPSVARDLAQILVQRAADVYSLSNMLRGSVAIPGENHET